MKYKTTDKEQKQNCGMVAGFGYCQIQNIERYLTPSAYTCGVYGWRADFYEFSGFTISTGYSPLEFLYNKTKTEKSRLEYIKKEILKLEKKLEARRYKFQKGGDWHKGHKFIIAKIEKIYLKSIELLNK